MADVFISHSSKDKKIADRICEEIEEQGISCWIAPRDITPGKEWAGEISAALREVKVLLLIYSKNSAASVQVPREISLAKKNGAVIVPFRIDDTGIAPAYGDDLDGIGWVNGSFDVNESRDDLYAIVGKAVGSSGRKIAARSIFAKNGKAKKKTRKIYLVLGSVFAASLVILLCSFVYNRSEGSGEIQPGIYRDENGSTFAYEQPYTDIYGRSGKYSGYWENDKPNGIGEFVYMEDYDGWNTIRLEAVFADGVASGAVKETVMRPDGETDIYTGEYSDGKRNGYGILNKYDDSNNITYNYKGMFTDGRESLWTYNNM